MVDSYLHLLDLITEDKELKSREGRNACDEIADERKLELRLAPPGEVRWWSLPGANREDNSCCLSLTLSQKSSNKTTNHCAGAKRGSTDALESKSRHHKQHIQKASSQNTNGIDVENKVQELSHDSTGLEQASPMTPASYSSKATATPKIFNTRLLSPRNSTAPVVGWPPVRSFRKNLASSSSKPSAAQNNYDTNEKSKYPEDRKTMFVKINIDGSPIGRKIDLKAYSSYENLSSAIDELFRCLLAGVNEEKPKTSGLLDGNCEYNLVYEDNEGDMMLVGDVPWNMFISTVKRLRVLMRSSELSSAVTVKPIFLS